MKNIYSVKNEWEVYDNYYTVENKNFTFGNIDSLNFEELTSIDMVEKQNFINFFEENYDAKYIYSYYDNDGKYTSHAIKDKLLVANQNFINFSYNVNLDPQKNYYIYQKDYTEQQIQSLNDDIFQVDKYESIPVEDFDPYTYIVSDINEVTSGYLEDAIFFIPSEGSMSESYTYHGYQNLFYTSSNKGAEALDDYYTTYNIEDRNQSIIKPFNAEFEEYFIKTTKQLFYYLLFGFLLLLIIIKIYQILITIFIAQNRKKIAVYRLEGKHNVNIFKELNIYTFLIFFFSSIIIPFLLLYTQNLAIILVSYLISGFILVLSNYKLQEKETKKIIIDVIKE